MFNQGMTLPMELKLVRTADGLRLARFPVKELEALREGKSTRLADFDGELVEVEFVCTPVTDATVTLDLRGVLVAYDAAKKTLTVNGRATAWDLDARGQLGLHVFVDRVGLEIFSCEGLQYLPLPEIVPDPAKRKLSWRAAGAKKPVRDVTERAWRLTGTTDMTGKAVF
jgi:sucrose-6-phosphate hydrolase SacC (GH32 family)